MAKTKTSFTPVLTHGYEDKQAARDVLSNLERSSYVLKPEQVGELARVYVEHQKELAAIGGSYFRVLIASTLAELGEKVKLEPHRGKAPKYDEAEKTRQLAAFEKTQTAFYNAVLDAVVSDDIKDDEQKPKAERSANALERNRRTNFARSAASTVRGYIKVGADLRVLNVATITKGQLQDIASARSPRKPEGVALGARVESLGKRSVRLIEQLAKVDEGAARHRLEALVATLASLLAHVGVEKTTDNEAQSIAKCIPLRTKAGHVFMPISDGNTLQ